MHSSYYLIDDIIIIKDDAIAIARLKSTFTNIYKLRT